jgi:hypothetical protein
MRDLAPGRYTVYAWEDLDNDAYLDADFLKTQQDHGVAIHAAPGPANPPLVLHAFPAPDLSGSLGILIIYNVVRNFCPEG